jgi:arylformamidase
MTVPFGGSLQRIRKPENLIVDLSRTLVPGESSFSEDPPFLVLPWHQHNIHGFATQVLFLPEHAATHVDVPRHFFKDAWGVEAIALERFFGRARALDPERLPRPLEETLLRKLNVAEGDIVLFVGNPKLTEEDAQALLACGVKGVGVEAESIDEPPFPLHRLFLQAGVLIYENLTGVAHLVGKDILFFGFPLKISSATASPVRAVAIILPSEDASGLP